MKKRILLLIGFVASFFLTGCGKNQYQLLAENVKQIELTGNLVTYQAYYHNVIEYEKKAGSGITHLLEEDRKLFEFPDTIASSIKEMKSMFLFLKQK